MCMVSGSLMPKVEKVEENELGFDFLHDKQPLLPCAGEGGKIETIVQVHVGTTAIFADDQAKYLGNTLAKCNRAVVGEKQEKVPMHSKQLSILCQNERISLCYVSSIERKMDKTNVSECLLMQVK